MDKTILAAIDQEIARLQQARALLIGTGRTALSSIAQERPKRVLSAKARKAIADAQRKRWAKVKSVQGTKAAAKKAVAENKK